MLAATRLLMSYLCVPADEPDPEDQITWEEQVQAGEDEFPMLDT